MRELLAVVSNTLDEDILVDTVLLTLFVGFLTAIQVLLPPELQTRLAFDHGAVVPWTLWTSAYVHSDMAHLNQNVFGFLGGVVVAYYLCWRLNARRWFWLTMMAFLTVLPPLVGLTSYATIAAIAPGATPVERGFSGVVAGIAGFIFVAFVAWVSRRSGPGVAQASGQTVCLLMVWLLSALYAGLGHVIVTGLTIVGLTLSGLLLVRNIQVPTGWTREQAWWADLQLAVGVGAVLLLFIVALFPTDVGSGGHTTNIFAHGAGLVWGALIAAGTWILETRYTRPETSQAS